MLSMNLTPRSLLTLPVSAFPDRADVYVCDKCGTDATKLLRPRISHSWSPMGPERFRCDCGETYLTGATEWDHFGGFERSKRAGDTIGGGFLLSVVFCVLGLVPYVILRFAFGSREAALWTWLVITATPFVAIQVSFWPGVFASMWRTRIARRFSSDKQNDSPA